MAICASQDCASPSHLSVPGLERARPQADAVPRKDQNFCPPASDIDVAWRAGCSSSGRGARMKRGSAETRLLDTSSPAPPGAKGADTPGCGDNPVAASIDCNFCGRKFWSARYRCTNGRCAECCRDHCRHRTYAELSE